jgi:NADH:ubiquinone oxidoreductase subunit 2 (subunit N)
MSFHGTRQRRNFDPVVLSVQVFVDLAMVLLACWLGHGVGVWAGAIKADPPGRDGHLYRELAALTAAVCLVTFHAFGMYGAMRTRSNVRAFRTVVKSTLVAFVVFLTLIVCLHGSLVTLHDAIDLEINPNEMSRLTLLATFGLIVVLMTASRLVSFHAIQLLDRRRPR